MLLATPLNPMSILWGKLISALSYVFILIFAAIPMASLVFIFGGVSLRDMLKALIVVGVVSILLGVVGIFNSALFGRTGHSTVITYVFVALLLFAPIFAAAASSVLRQGDLPRWMLIPSPICALFSAITPSIRPETLSSMFWSLSSVFWAMGNSPISYTSIPRPLYHYSLPLYGCISILLYLVTTRLVRPTLRWRIRLEELSIGLVLILGYAGIVAIAFLGTSNRYENIQIQTQTTNPPGVIEPADNFVLPTPLIATPDETATIPASLRGSATPYPIR
jgi:ABC-2 type transport system permease protein